MLTDKRKKEFASLHRRRNRERLDAFVVEGARSVDAALAAEAEAVFLIETPDASSTARSEVARKLGAEVATLSDLELSRISDVDTTQGVLLIARRNLSAETQLLACATILILDGVQDPANVGSLLRTAAWFGVDGVLAGRGTADFYNSKTVRASMGGIWDLELAQSNDLNAWLSEWKVRGGKSWAADMQGANVDEWVPGHPSALIIGSEAHGIAPERMEFVDGCVHIPASDRAVGSVSGSGSVPGSNRVTESLSASVAGGLLLSSWMRKRGF